ncbi:MAG: immunity 17 family protein [Ruminococcus sp.]|uniref:Imm17 family immunity protein n=1 Tax=Ruminococcus sp. TaxID=41978 RepID=UPI0025D14A1D|nr:Imm17 family immunity protein [Ruminococcus sp.]MBR0528311.1 immunity 17 family protein [Ruminococcus sp.]
MTNVFAFLMSFAVGFFAIFCAYKDYDWFMNSHKARIFVKLFGRNGARIFYMGLGVFIVVIGLLLVISG